MTRTEIQKMDDIIAVDLMGMDFALRTLKCDLDSWQCLIIAHDYTILTSVFNFGKLRATEHIRRIADRLKIELPHGIID